MKAPAQGSSHIVIVAPRALVWDILIDSQHLPELLPMVRSTTGRTESLNSVRTCQVDFNGKPGQVTERCTEFVPMNHIGWIMEAETLGFARIIENLGFDFRLEDFGPEATRVVNTTYYTPRGVLGALMSLVLIKRNFRRTRETVLAGVKRLAEAAPAMQPA